MIQVILPALVAIAAGRALSNKNGEGEKRSPTIATFSPAMWSVLWKLTVVSTMVFTALAFDFSRPVGWATVVASVLFCLPTLLVSPLLVRFGRPRLAYWTLRCCMPLHHIGNQRAGALLYATLSATRMRDPAAACVWLEQRLREKPVKGALGQTILGHLAALQGDRITAKCLFDSIDSRLWQPRQALVRITARDWLVMDAARRGDWDAAVRYNEFGGGSTRWSRAVAGMLRPLAGRPRLHDWQLRLLWVLAPHRLRLRPMLQRAMSDSVRALPTEPTEPTEPRDLAAALACLADVVAKAAQPAGAVSSAEFVAAVRCVSLRLEGDDIKATLQQRLAALDSTLNRSEDTVLAEFRSQLVDLVLPAIAANPCLVAQDREHPIIAAAFHRLRAATLESIDMRAKDLARRALKKQARDPLSEWQSWAALCDEANRLLTMQPDAGASLFEMLLPPLHGYAVFQHNEGIGQAFAHDIFRWLRERAPVGHRVVEMLDNNIACYGPD